MKAGKIAFAQSKGDFRCKGFTILEAVAAVAIVVVLGAIVSVGVRGYRERAEGVLCASNLRSLQVALVAATQDEGHWPQVPPEIDGDPDMIEDWWIKALSPYGIEEKDWQCPSIKRKVSNRSSTGRPKLHYQPTEFDSRPGTPYRWATQPWLIEIGNMHGDGALICFPDGSIRSMNDVLGE